MQLQNSNSNLLASSSISVNNPAQSSGIGGGGGNDPSMSASSSLNAATAAAAAAMLSSSQSTSSAFKTSKDNLLILPVRMEIGLKAFIQIADSLQMQKETKEQMPSMPATFLTPSSECLSVYLSNQLSAMNKRVTAGHHHHPDDEASMPSQLRVMLNDALARDIGIYNYFEPVRRAFQDILKTLDSTIGRTFLMTRPENNAAQQASSSVSTGSSLDPTSVVTTVTSSGGVVADQPMIATGGSDVVNSQASGSVVGGSVGGSGTTTGSQGQGTRSANELDPGQRHDDSNYLNTSGGSTSFVMSQMSKDLIFTSENRARLGLLKTCVALIPRMMPMFKGKHIFFK